MIGTATLIIVVKSKSSLIILAAALINFATAERARQSELIKEMGTLACQIENCKLLDQECSALQRQYELLAKLKKGLSNEICSKGFLSDRA